MEKFIELLKALHGDEEITAELIKGMEDMPADQVTELESALSVVNDYRKLYPDEILDAIKVLSKHASYGRTGGTGEELTLEDATEFVVDELGKAGRKVSKETKAKLLKIMSLIKEIVGDETDDPKKKSLDLDKYENLPDEIKAKLLKLEKMEKEQEDAAKKKEKEERELEKAQLKQALADIEMLKAGTGVRKSFDPEDLTEEEKKELLKSETPVKYPSLMKYFRRD